jgi:WD40 repeat protein
LIAASDDKRIWLLNPATLSKLTTRPSVDPFSELRFNITQLVFSPKEKWIGAIMTSNDVVIYNTQNRSGKTLQPKNLVQAIVFSPDEKQLLIGDGAGNLQVWDTSTGTFQDTPLALSSRITAMTASADLLAIGTDNTVILFDVNTLAEVARLESRGAPELLVFSPDGSLLASNNSAGQIQVWTQADGKFTGPNVTIKESASALAFSSSNKWLAVGAVDKVYLLNPLTLEEYARIPHTGTVSSVSFSADDATLMTSSLKVIQFWDMATIQEVKKERIVEIACQHLIEDLTEDQWSTLFETKVYQPICGKPPIP